LGEYTMKRWNAFVQLFLSRLREFYREPEVIFWVYGFPVLLAVGLVADGTGLLRMPTAAEAAALLYLATVVSAGAFLLWYDALPRLGADRAGLFAGLVPVGAIATTVLLGLGAPTATELGGAALVIAGLLVGLAPSRPRTAAASPAPAATPGG
jgi:drug/metabolite transporter (DMT)-like permease